MSLLSRRGKRHAAPQPATPVDVMDADGLYRHLLTSPTGTWAYFELGPSRWFYTSTGERSAVLTQTLTQVIALVGHRIQLRQTSEPFSWEDWARGLYESHPNRLPDPEVDPQQAAELVARWGYNPLSNSDRSAAQQTLIASAGKSSDRPVAYLGVRLTSDRVKREDLPRLFTADQLSKDLTAVRDTMRAVRQSLSRGGLKARPVTGVELDWLLHRSAALGVPVEPTDLVGEPNPDLERGAGSAVSGNVEVRQPEPYSPHVEVRANRGGRQITRYVSVLTVDHLRRRDPLDGSVAPWLAYFARLEAGVEVSATFEVQAGRDLVPDAEAVRRRCEHVAEHYEEHGERPPQRVTEGIEDAFRIEGEVNSSDPERSTRLGGPIRVAVWGESPEECADNVRALKAAAYADVQVTLVHDARQYARYREFVPGNPVEVADFATTMPAYYFVSAVPTAANTAGEEGGFYHGQVVGGGVGSYFHDPFYGPRHNKSGFHTITATLGYGKSVLGGSILYDAATNGVRALGFDPSGSWTRLARMPELARHSRVIELSSATPGALNPYTLIPEPIPADFENDGEWREALREANAERRDYMMDTLVLLLPPRVVAEQAGSVAAIEAAVETAGGAYGLNPWRVIDALRADGDYASGLADMLERTSTAKGSALVWPEDRIADEAGGLEDRDETLTVITMRGLVTPPAGVDRAYWLRSERMAMPVMHLASRGLALRTLYAHRGPKVIVNDETGIATAGQSSWSSYILRASRDSRKHEGAIYSLGQNVGDMTRIDAEITNLIGSAWVGHLDVQSAEAALGALGLPAGQGYERIPARLGTGEWLRRGWDGQVERYQHVVLPHLLDALNSTPEERATKAALEDVRLAEEQVLTRRSLAAREGRVAA